MIRGLDISKCIKGFSFQNGLLRGLKKLEFLSLLLFVAEVDTLLTHWPSGICLCSNKLPKSSDSAVLLTSANVLQSSSPVENVFGEWCQMVLRSLDFDSSPFKKYICMM